MMFQPPNSGDLENMEILLRSEQQVAKALQEGEITLLNHAAAIAMAMQEVQPVA